MEVTSSPPTGFVCPPEQCNVTTNTTTITGLNCSREYSFTVTAVNCIGSSTANIPLTTSSELCYWLLHIHHLDVSGVATPGIDRACFVNNTISITLQVRSLTYVFCYIEILIYTGL